MAYRDTLPQAERELVRALETAHRAAYNAVDVGEPEDTSWFQAGTLSDRQAAVVAADPIVKLLAEAQRIWRARNAAHIYYDHI